MKPIKLHMKNIGPYLDETIDFSNLDNMFLIKGDTGAGKSFIFDAITYALYGSLGGNRNYPGSTIRSRYANELDDAEIDYEFEVGGTVYKVHRVLPRNYINRNGKKDQKPMSVDLQVRDGGNFTEISGKTSEIDKKIESIIGLSASEFSLVVVLPQGEFANFLKQSSKERALTLKKLFPVDYFTNLAERIKEKADNAEQELKQTVKVIEGLSQGKDFSCGEETISSLNQEIQNCTDQKNELQQKLNEYIRIIENLKNKKKDAEEYQKNCSRLNELQSQKESFDLKSEKITKGDRAKSVHGDIRLYKNNIENQKKTCNLLAESQKELEELESQKNKLLEQKSEIDVLREQNDKDTKNLAVLNEKVSKIAGYEEKKKQLESSLKEKTELETQKEQIEKQFEELMQGLKAKVHSEIADEISTRLMDLNNKKNDLNQELEKSKNYQLKVADKEKFEQELKAKEQELTVEQKKHEELSLSLKDLQEKKKEYEQKNQAFHLALVLKAGCPCPVCGSMEHPSPAEKPVDFVDIDSLIKDKTELLDYCGKSLKDLQVDAGKAQTNLDNVNNEIASIGTVRKESVVQAEIDKITSEESSFLNKKQTYSELKSKEEKIDSAYAKVNQKYIQVETEVKNLKKEFGKDPQILKEETDKLTEELTINKKTVEDWDQNKASNDTALATCRTSIKKYQDDISNLKNDEKTLKDILDKKLEEYGFKNQAEALAAFIEDSELESLRKEYSDYCEELRSVTDAVQNGKKKNLKLIEEIDSKLQEVQNIKQETENQFKTIEKDLESKNKELATYEDIFNKIRDEQNKKIALEAKLEPLKALKNNLTGSNPQKMTLETWALGTYFEEVVESASIRFNHISNGRFSFSLKGTDSQVDGNGFKGLDLAIFDAYNGKPANPCSLSGGETFEASISLALAITDVVQNGNGGGIKLDSLFIDEGFGTLDPETLEKAMQVLSELSETKMIGIISHVSDLEKQSGITSSISVDKTTHGSHIRVSF